MRAAGATVVPVDLTDVEAVAAASAGASCVVSTLSGLREVIVDRQSVLLDGAVTAGVPRFISSDYAADFTKTAPGSNRNFDLRRDFMGVADRAPIDATSIFTGAFMDRLGAEMPIIQPRIRRVLYWGDRQKLLDFTTRDDTAAFTAQVALDPTAPRVLRVAGAVVSEERGVSGMAGHAVHARPVRRAGQAHPAGQRPVPRPHLDTPAHTPARALRQSPSLRDTSGFSVTRATEPGPGPVGAPHAPAHSSLDVVTARAVHLADGSGRASIDTVRFSIG